MTRLGWITGTVVLASCTACAGAPPPDHHLTRADVATGKVLYDTNGCAACHGREGRGDGPLAPSLNPPPRDFIRGDSFKEPRTVVAIADVIARGIPSTPTPMPAFAHLDLESRRRLAGYVLSIGGGPAASTPRKDP